MREADRRRAWDRRPDETAAAFAAFGAYKDLGVGRRSVRLAWEARTGRSRGVLAPTRWRAWSKQHQWPERARCWDEWLANLYEAEARRRIEQDAAAHAAQLQAQRENELRTGQRLMAKATEMLSFPISSRTVKAEDDGRTVVIISPLKWTLGDAARMADVACKLIRRATGQPVSDVELEASERAASWREISDEGRRLVREMGLPDSPDVMSRLWEITDQIAQERGFGAA